MKALPRHPLPEPDLYPLAQLAGIWGCDVQKIVRYGVEGKIYLSVQLSHVEVPVSPPFSQGFFSATARPVTLEQHDLGTISATGEARCRQFILAYVKHKDGSCGFDYFKPLHWQHVPLTDLVVTREEKHRFEQRYFDEPSQRQTLNLLEIAELCKLADSNERATIIEELVNDRWYEMGCTFRPHGAYLWSSPDEMKQTAIKNPENFYLQKLSAERWLQSTGRLTQSPVAVTAASGLASNSAEREPKQIKPLGNNDYAATSAYAEAWKKARLFASECWEREKQAGTRITRKDEMVKAFLAAAMKNRGEFGLIGLDIPKKDTVRGWIKDIAPLKASRPGRPRKG